MIRKPGPHPLSKPQKLSVPSDNIPTKASRVQFQSATPRNIYPPVPIEHGTGKKKFYECSSCGYTASKVRSSWHKNKPCTSGTVLFTHRLKPTDPLTKHKYLDLINQLYHQDEPITQHQKQMLIYKYSNFVAQFNLMRQNSADGQLMRQLMAKNKELIKQLQEAHKYNQQLIPFVEAQNQKLTQLLAEYRSGSRTQLQSQTHTQTHIHSVAFQKQERREVQTATKSKEEEINDIIAIVTPTLRTHFKALLNKFFKEKRKIDPVTIQYAFRQLQDQIYQIDISNSYNKYQ